MSLTEREDKEDKKLVLTKISLTKDQKFIVNNLQRDYNITAILKKSGLKLEHLVQCWNAEVIDGKKFVVELKIHDGTYWSDSDIGKGIVDDVKLNKEEIAIRMDQNLPKIMGKVIIDDIVQRAQRLTSSIFVSRQKYEVVLTQSSVKNDMLTILCIKMTGQYHKTGKSVLDANCQYAVVVASSLELEDENTKAKLDQFINLFNAESDKPKLTTIA